MAVHHFSTYEEYLRSKRSKYSSVDVLMVEATAKYLGRDIWIVKSSLRNNVFSNGTFLEKISGGPTTVGIPKILIGHHQENHYESLKGMFGSTVTS